jgi:hypothetical protein
MKKDEAKFLLRAYRAQGADAQDPAFAEALAAARNDPELAAWLAAEEAFDATLARKLQEITPPVGLEEAIIAGIRAGEKATPVRRIAPLWFGLSMAAGIALVLVATFQLSRTRSPAANGLAAMAIHDLATAHDQHEGNPPRLASILAQLTTTRLPLPAHLEIDLDELALDRCRTVNFGDWQAYEICFQRQGVWFHLYAGRADTFPGRLPEADEAATHTVSTGPFSAVAWRNGDVAYALVSRSALLPRVVSMWTLSY